MPPNTSSTGGYLQPQFTTLVEDDALDKILASVVGGITGLPVNLVRPRWQLIPPPQPEPTTNWCAIGIVDEEIEYTDASQHYSAFPSTTTPPDPTGDGYTITWENKILDILASFYGPNSRYLATLLRHGISVRQNREQLFLNNMALMEPPGRIVNASAIVNQQSYRQYDVAMKIRYKITSQWAINNIQQADITLNTERQEGVEIISPPSVEPFVEPPGPGVGPVYEGS